MTSAEVTCSFCGKRQQDVVSIISGVSVNLKGQEGAAVICDECVQLFVQVIAIQHPEWLERHRQFVANLGK
jgi:ATP-dependent protease Clp ATPase subunit